MACRLNPRSILVPATVLLLVVGCSGPPGVGVPVDPPKEAPAVGRKLSHEETLRWIDEHRAWKQARKTRPIWARAVAPEEVGKEFQTADHVKEVAQKDAWLCVGVAGEPWFQALTKIESKYEPDGEEEKTFAFDPKPIAYRKFKPRGTVRNWVARVEGPGIEGFFIKPNYDPSRPLYSPAGGYVVKDDAKEPYGADPKEVWLVQQALFESTYEIIPPAP
jgi:hypothetical protein